MTDIKRKQIPLRVTDAFLAQMDEIRDVPREVWMRRALTAELQRQLDQRARSPKPQPESQALKDEKLTQARTIINAWGGIGGKAPMQKRKK